MEKTEVKVDRDVLCSGATQTKVKQLLALESAHRLVLFPKVNKRHRRGQEKNYDRAGQELTERRETLTMDSQ